MKSFSKYFRSFSLIAILFFVLGVASLARASEQFLSLSDLHFDPFLACQEKKPCPFIQQLQEAPASEWSALFSSQDHSLVSYGKDTNYQLFASALRGSEKEAKTAHVRFVLVLGDFLAHDYHKKYLEYSNNKTEAGYVQFVKKTLSFLSAEFQKAFPQTDVYLVVGNNDSFKDDYSVMPEGDFFKVFSQEAAPLIHTAANRKAFTHDFPHGGYFAVDAPSQPNIRLVFLNSVLFSNKAEGEHLSEAANSELDWLHQELQKATDRKQKVLIAMHIPTGIDVYMTLYTPFTLVEFWKTAYSKRFLEEIQHASPHILGVFQGHIHADSFQILSGLGQKPLPLTGTPSISPIFGNNPGFKIYSYSPQDPRLLNFVTYYRSLEGDAIWEKEYDFDEVYQKQNHNEELIKGMLQLTPRGELAERYKVYYTVNRDSQPITKQNKWLPYYWCAIRGLTSTDYQECVHSSTT